GAFDPGAEGAGDADAAGEPLPDDSLTTVDGRTLSGSGKRGSAKRSFHFATVSRTSAGLAWATRGNVSSFSNGRQASISARVLYGTAGFSSSGSTLLPQDLRMMSMSPAGSQRVQTAHITSSRFIGSTSSSTTITKRFM